MTDRRVNNLWDRRGEEGTDDPETPFDIIKLYRPERRKDAKLRAELDARAEVIMAGLPAPPCPPMTGLKTRSVRFGVYAALRHGR